MATKSSQPTVPFPEHALGKSFEPASFEGAIYSFWEENGCFEASDKCAPKQRAFSIVIPPPNVTGVLHMGHALTNTIQDILIRWRRMKGENALWLPGTDHAGIATQAQVEKQIAKEGKAPTGKPFTRHDLGREAFVARTWKWKEEHGSQITRQLKRMGSSLDWKRERFTMDEGFSSAVREVFVRLYEEGLIYRGERIINWCPRCQTALSDLEVIPSDRKGHLWKIAYEVVDEGGGTPIKLVIATTRPETLLGDTAVAVHPEDERYKHLIGKKAKLPLLGRLVPIIGDGYVDREFGSGALKVTPAHDFNDYDIGKRHDLPFVSVMGKDGRISSAGGPYSGLKFSEARERVIQDLAHNGLLIATEAHQNKVGLCQRCDNVAEPVVSKQWFVKIKPLAEPAIKAVEEGRITFTPRSWEKTYFEWMYNIRDWCISRQLWWGHQIPAWYCGRCQEVTVARAKPPKCGKCGASGADLKQDEDVLDTWFSSALWPFGTLGWPEQTQALKTFYPTSILETGFDIIFFWVARMIMMGIHFMGEVPFNKVYLHAMVRDEKGEKMSKSKGNVIDPLVLIEKHGADPLRFTLAAMAGQGRDIKLSVDRVEGYRAFCNKIWNAVKFFLLQLEPENGGPMECPKGGPERWLLEHQVELLPMNKWILSRTQKLVESVERSLEHFELDEAARAIYEFSWHELCDWYIELAKLPLKDSDTRPQTLITLYYVLERLLRTAHPFMPFVTEELWQALPCVDEGSGKGKKLTTIMLQSYPTPEPTFMDPEAERTLAALRSIIEAVRNFRGENNISPKVHFSVFYVPKSSAAGAFVRLHQITIMALARVDRLVWIEGSDRAVFNEAVIPLTTPPVELHIPLEGLVDRAEEAKRLTKEIEKLKSDLEHVRGKLSKETFLAKAPPALVAKERANEKELAAQIEKLEASVAGFKGSKSS